MGFVDFWARAQPATSRDDRPGFRALARMAARSTTASPAGPGRARRVTTARKASSLSGAPAGGSLRRWRPPRLGALSVFGVEEGPADAFDELRCDMGIADIRRRHALLQLERAASVAGRGGLVRR